MGIFAAVDAPIVNSIINIHQEYFELEAYGLLTFMCNDNLFTF